MDLLLFFFLKYYQGKVSPQMKNILEKFLESGPHLYCNTNGIYCNPKEEVIDFQWFPVFLKMFMFNFPIELHLQPLPVLDKSYNLP